MKRSVLQEMCLMLLLAWISAVLTVPFTKHYEDFNIHILEKGLKFDQEVELDETEQVVTVRVPGHNNVDETYFITDTKTHLTMKVAPRQQICFLIKNDPEELPSVDIWKKTKEYTKDKVITDVGAVKRRRSYVITEPLSPREWASIPRRMQKMCGGLPAVWTEVLTEDYEQSEHQAGKEFIMYMNKTNVDGSRRFKRQLPDDTFIDRCSRDDSAQKCVVYENSCYRVLTCETKLDVNGRDGSDCNQMDHIYEDVRCCKPCCLADVPDSNPSPPCGVQITKEKLCPNKQFL